MEGSDFRPRKCTKKDEILVDWISELPDDILVYILSFLTVEDAARTSVLSKRWIDLWMFISRLDFGTSKLWEGLQGVNEISKYVTLRNSKRLNYVKWVNKVLQSHKATVLDKFSIQFDLGKSSQDDIDKWLQFALTKKVQRLDLSLSQYRFKGLAGSLAYVFPHDLLGLGNGNSPAVSVSGYCGNGINSDVLHGFKTLRSLTFKNVNVSGEVLESLLLKCPVLEYLVVVGSGHQKKFKVCGPTLALKHLEIIYCPRLRSLTVCNTNLVSLKITTDARCLVLQNVPMLADAYVGGFFENFIHDAVSYLSCCLSKLEFLTLRVLDTQIRREEKTNDAAFPQLTKLKQLTLVVLGSFDDSLMGFTSLVRACPNLEKFVLKLQWEYNIKKIYRAYKKGREFPLDHLKVVEVCGYYGRSTEVELVNYFLENAVALEKIIVDPRSAIPLFSPRPELPEKEEMARKHARMIIPRALARRQLQSRVELVIL